MSTSRICAWATRGIAVVSLAKASRAASSVVQGAHFGTLTCTSAATISACWMPLSRRMLQDSSTAHVSVRHHNPWKVPPAAAESWRLTIDAELSAERHPQTLSTSHWQQHAVTTCSAPAHLSSCVSCRPSAQNPACMSCHTSPCLNTVYC